MLTKKILPRYIGGKILKFCTTTEWNLTLLKAAAARPNQRVKSIGIFVKFFDTMYDQSLS
jgi:hypothetical protein